MFFFPIYINIDFHLLYTAIFDLFLMIFLIFPEYIELCIFLIEIRLLEKFFQ